MGFRPVKFLGKSTHVAIDTSGNMSVKLRVLCFVLAIYDIVFTFAVHLKKNMSSTNPGYSWNVDLFLTSCCTQDKRLFHIVKRKVNFFDDGQEW